MTRVLFTLATLLTGRLAAGEAAPLMISVERPAGSAADVTVTLRSAEDPALAAVTVALAKESSAAAVQLPHGAWSLDATSDDSWHERQYVIVPAETTVTATLLPKAIVQGRLTVDGDMPAEVELRLRDAEQWPPASNERLVVCPVREGRFHCDVPAGTHDLRLRAPGFIAHVLLSRRLPAARTTDVGAIRLRRGQTIVASVSVPKGTDLARVRVVAERANTTTASGKATATPNARGVVQLEGIAPGAYSVRATHPDGLSSVATDVTVRAGTETIIRQPLALERPRRLTVRIDPPLSPDGSPWVLGLSRTIGVREHDVAATGAASETGEWVSEPLQPADFTLTVGPPGPDKWHSEPVTLRNGDQSLNVRIRTRQARGTLHLGDEPLAASIIFVRKEPALRSAETDSDAEGRFALTLPDPTATEWEVSVVAREPNIRRTLEVEIPEDGEELEIVLPAAKLSGIVTDAEGTPVPGAVVDVSGPAEMPSAQAISGEDGTFFVFAAPSGEYGLRAAAGPRGQSATVSTVIGDGDPMPVTLVVQPSKELRGQVVSPSGPVAAARVHVAATNVWVPVEYTYTTRADGTFTAMIPAAVTELDLMIAPPGFSLTAAHIPYRPEMFTVTVQQNGGTLELRGAGQQDDARLYHDGAMIHLRGPIAYEWPVQRDGTTLVLPQMEPGVYRLCVPERCAQGFLPPHGSLALDVR